MILNGTIDNNGNLLTITVTGTDDQIDINGTISRAGGMTNNGSGFVVRSDSANSYAGTTTIDGGGLTLRSNGTLGSVAGGTIVHTRENLLIRGGIDYSELESVTLAGDGLLGSTENNTFAAPVTLTSDSSIGAFP